jgi:hypothetical protein
MGYLTLIWIFLLWHVLVSAHPRNAYAVTAKLLLAYQHLNLSTPLTVSGYYIILMPTTSWRSLLVVLEFGQNRFVTNTYIHRIPIAFSLLSTLFDVLY